MLVLDNIRVTICMIIYRIFNKINGKSYIGQTTYSFKHRYWGEGWHINTHNQYLKRAVKKYGLLNFEVSFLAENVESIEKLNQLEEFFIKEYNSIYPNGYNFKSGGDNKKHLDITISKIQKSRLNTLNIKWQFKNHKTGEIIKPKNLAEFCRIYNLSRTMMHHVHTGKNKRHKEWTLPETNIKSWKIKHPIQGEVVILEGELNLFCRQRGLHKNGILSLFQIGKSLCHTYKGWTKA